MFSFATMCEAKPRLRVETRGRRWSYVSYVGLFLEQSESQFVSVLHSVKGSCFGAFFRHLFRISFFEFLSTELCVSEEPNAMAGSTESFL